MFEQTGAHPSPERADGEAVRVERPATSLEDIQAAANFAHQEQDRIQDAEVAAETSDRQQVIGQYLIDQELFGYEPYGDETLTALTDILVREEIKRRDGVDPEFDITQWSSRRIGRILERNFLSEEDRSAAESDEIARDTYRTARDEILAASPEISNAELCRQLLARRGAVPEVYRLRLQAFITMQNLAANEADAAVISERINALDFTGEIPDPMVFLQTQVLSTPEHDTGISEATQTAMREAFGIPALRDSTDLLDTIDQIGEDEGRFVDANGQVVTFDQNNGIPLGDYTIYPDASEANRYLADTLVGGRTLRVSFSRDTDPSFLDEIITAAMVSQVLANRDLQAANQYILGGDGLAAQGIAEINLDEFQVARAKRLYGAFMGLGVETRTGFPDQSQLRSFEWRLQGTHIDGDGKTGDNTGRGDQSWRDLGMLTNDGLNMQRVEEIGAYMNTYSTAVPDFETLKEKFGTDRDAETL
ncbi:MAG: hypothetical protein AAFX02_08195 [Pseudomonadota bacterium]